MESFDRRGGEILCTARGVLGHGMAALSAHPPRTRSTWRRRPTPVFGTSSTEPLPARTPRSTSGSSPRARLRSPGGRCRADRARRRWIRRRRVRGRRVPVRRLLVPRQGVRPRGLPDPVHGRGHADSTRNGGVMIRTPEIRYTGAEHHRRRSPRSRPASTTKSARARPRSADLTTPAPSKTTRGRARRRSVPAGVSSSVGRLLRPAHRRRRLYVNGLNNTPLTTNGNADNASTGPRSPAAMRSRSTSP